jgi:hypothetical protein
MLFSFLLCWGARLEEVPSFRIAKDRLSGKASGAGATRPTGWNIPSRELLFRSHRAPRRLGVASRIPPRTETPATPLE